MGHKATRVLRDGRTALPDADSGGFVAHNPGADDGVDGIELRRWHQRLVNIGALSIVAARASLIPVGCNRDARAFAAKYWLLNMAAAKRIGCSVCR